MARCWTCGAAVAGWRYTCPLCEGVSELKRLQDKIESHHGDASEKLDYMIQVQLEGFRELRTTLSYGLSVVASALEWGFGELSWELQQQTDILRSIDRTLKTPSQTQANEWRQMSEELRRRGVLDKAEELYVKALELNPLDYRIYVGLAETYLRMNQFDKARILLEQSLPHAPKQEIDYKSYSYRLIGHIYACEEQYGQAVSALRSSIELSPDYTEGHYDFAQYCALVRERVDCVSSLQKAISAKPLYFYLAREERNFHPLKREVQDFLEQIGTEAHHKAENAIFEAQNALGRAQAAIHEVGASDVFEQEIAAASKFGQRLLKENGVLAYRIRERGPQSLNDLVRYLKWVAELQAHLRWMSPGEEPGVHQSRVEDIYLKAERLQEEAARVYQEILGGVDRKDMTREHKRRAQRTLSSEGPRLAVLLRDLEQTLKRPRGPVLDSQSVYEKAKLQMDLAKSKVASADYMALLEAKLIVQESTHLANAAQSKARAEREYLARTCVEYKERRVKKARSALLKLPFVALYCGVICAIIGTIGGYVVGHLLGHRDAGGSIGFFVGIILGLLLAVDIVRDEIP